MNSCIDSSQMSHGTWPIFYYAFKPNQYGWKSSGRRLAVRWSKICFHQIVQYLSTCTCWAHLPRENSIFSDLLAFCPSLESKEMHFLIKDSNSENSLISLFSTIIFRDFWSLFRIIHEFWEVLELTSHVLHVLTNLYMITFEVSV